MPSSEVDSPRLPVPPRFNAARHVLLAAADAAKPALVTVADAADPAGDRIISYGDLRAAVAATAAGLRARDFAPGSRVLLRLADTPDFPVVHLALMASGLVSVPVSAQLTGDDIATLAEDADAVAVVSAGDLPIGRAGEGRAVLHPAALVAAGAGAPLTFADTGAGDEAFMIYTSGTTARPKGVRHAHRALFARLPMVADWYGMTADDVMLHAGAFNWTYTLGTGLMDPWANGATAVVVTGAKEPSLWPRLIARTGATLFAAVPGLYRRILKYASPTPADLGRLRHGLTAGEALPDALAREWEAATGRTLREAFGMSEISTYVSTPPGTSRRPGSPGRPQRGRRVALLPVEGGDTPVPLGETGIIAVHRSDPGLMLGYHRRPQEEAATRRGNWFLTGDLATMDADGFIYPHGRADDLMNPMGYRVSPAEVEAVLMRHPFVQECAVTEIEPRPGVRIIAAFVVPSDAAATEPPAAITAALATTAAEALPAYKRPREWRLVAALPRTANGKITRKALAALQDQAGC